MPVSSTYQNICTQCKAYCCTLVTPPITEHEKQRIIDAGYPDYFEKIHDDLYIIKSDSSLKCPYLNDNYLCSIQAVKPLLCALWPVIPHYKNRKRGCIIISCPLFPLLSKETIEHARKEAEQVPLHIIEHLWVIPEEIKEKYKRFEYQKL